MIFDGVVLAHSMVIVIVGCDSDENSFSICKNGLEIDSDVYGDSTTVIWSDGATLICVMMMPVTTNTNVNGNVTVPSFYRIILFFRI